MSGIEQGGETQARDWTWISADSRRHTVSMTLAAADRVAGARVGYHLCVRRDVTEARDSQEMLMAALEKDGSPSSGCAPWTPPKNEFRSDGQPRCAPGDQHRGLHTEFLRDGTLVEPAEEQRPMLESIARNGQRRSRCATTCSRSAAGLRGSRLGPRHGDLDPHPRPAPRDAARCLAGPPPPDVSCGHPARPGVRWPGNAQQLERALTNLLSNAIKFTDDGGGITVTVASRRRRGPPSVSDTGIGIPVEEQDPPVPTVSSLPLSNARHPAPAWACRSSTRSCRP